MQRITPCLWFDTQAEEAANFYVSLFEDSKVTDVQRLDGTPSGDNVALCLLAELTTWPSTVDRGSIHRGGLVQRQLQTRTRWTGSGRR
jgi:hypothetical protein